MGARITGRIDPVQRTIGAYIPEGEPKARAEAFARFAIGERTRVERESYNGKPPARTTTVDGRKGASEFSVKPEGGRIEYEWQALTPVLEWLLDALFRASPLGPTEGGHYREDHELWADGRPASPSSIPANWSELVVMNSRPYARRLEQRYSIYQTTARFASQRFGRLARFRFAYRSTVTTGPKRAATTRVPAIVVTRL